jgi:hypothetical protein
LKFTSLEALTLIEEADEAKQVESKQESAYHYNRILCHGGYYLNIFRWSG